MEVLLIYKRMEPLPCLPLFAFWNLVVIFKQSSQHRIGRQTDSVVLIMGSNKVLRFTCDRPFTNNTELRCRTNHPSSACFRVGFSCH